MDNADITLDMLRVGQVWKAWSERIMGVWVDFTVTKIGRKWVHGTMRYGDSQWQAKISTKRLIGTKNTMRQEMLKRMGASFDGFFYGGPDQVFPSYAWPGGYEMFFIMDDGETLCTTCANDSTNPVHFADEYNENDGWLIIGVSHVGEVDSDTRCSHCNKALYEDDEPTEHNGRG